MPSLARARGVLTVLTVLLAGFAVPTSAHALDLGFNDFDLTHSANGTPEGAAALAAGLRNARSAGATTWRFSIYWSAAAPTRPPSPADPASPGYEWRQSDELVRAITAAGFTPVLWLGNAPAWAEGPDRPASSALVPNGTWKPNAAEFRLFATAVATRYSGSYPDPLAPGATLPRVATFQGWNEPNLYTNLTPQWERISGRWQLTAPGTYRALQNAAYAGIKQAQPDATVLSAGTGPYGDLYPGQPRSGPALFWRELLCVTRRRGQLVGRRSCTPTRFDAWSHHPYSVGPPARKAINPDDAVVADVPKLTAILTAAARAGTVSRAAVAQRWVTELSWDSSPDPAALSPARQASYMAEAFFVLWQAGVRHVIWWNSRDDARGEDWASSLQSGVFFRGADPSADTPKPSLTAYRFPFVAKRSGGRVTLWAQAPAAGRVVIERRRGGRWTALRTLTAGTDGIATARMALPRRSALRAVQDTERSRTWTTS